jgi:hypothetical protein
MTSQIKTITSILKALTDIIKNIPAPIGLAEILVIMSVLTFKIAIILYLLCVKIKKKIYKSWINFIIIKFIHTNINILTFSDTKRQPSINIKYPQKEYIIHWTTHNIMIINSVPYYKILLIKIKNL